jgi:hypothetical protein
VPRQVGDLRLPLPHVDDRPGGEQHDRRLPGAVHVVADPDAAAFGGALVVRFACPHVDPPGDLRRSSSAARGLRNTPTGASGASGGR